jgi:hypothetical protein
VETKKHVEERGTLRTHVPQIQLQPTDTSREFVRRSVELGDHINIHFENQQKSQKKMRASHENANSTR